MHSGFSSVARRIVLGLVFISVAWIAADCQAQQRRLFPRIFRAHQPLIQQAPHSAKAVDTTEYQHHHQGPQTQIMAAPSYRPWTDSGAYVDPRVRFDATGWERYPKWYGGFHSSHFTNLGIPAGDRGFRGNSIYWTPW